MNILHNPEQRRFTLTQNGETAHVAYLIENGALDIRHTIVPAPLEGQGIASALVKAAYDYALQQGYVCVATCAYAVRCCSAIPSTTALPARNTAKEMHAPYRPLSLFKQ